MSSELPNAAVATDEAPMCAEENEGLQAFQRALESNGAEFPDSFVVTLHGVCSQVTCSIKPRVYCCLPFATESPFGLSTGPTHFLMVPLPGV